MFKSIFFTVIIFSLISCAPFQNHDTKINIEQQPSYDLKQALHDLVAKKDTAPTEISGIQMVLIKKGQVAFEHAEGFARIDSNKYKIPLTIDHKVRIASISKFVLTMAFMSLVEEGKIDLDEDVSKYTGFELINKNYPQQKITIRHLLSHTSSIRDAGYYFLPLSENYHDFFRPSMHYENGAHFSKEPNQGPGKYFTYTNLNFGILAGIIENISGMRMDIFVQEKLFKPLQLNISFNVCDLFENNFSTLATLYRRGEGGSVWEPNGQWKSQVDGNRLGCFYGDEKINRTTVPDKSKLSSYQIASNPTLFSPQGGLRASAKDLAKLMLLMIGNQNNSDDQKLQNIISKSSIDAMLTPVWSFDEKLKNGDTGGEISINKASKFRLMSSYGLSTHIIDLKDWGLTTTSKRLYGHLGSAYGLLGQFWFDPITEDGMVILITGVGDDPAKPQNTTPLHAIEEVVLKMAILGLEEYR